MRDVGVDRNDGATGRYRRPRNHVSSPSVSPKCEFGLGNTRASVFKVSP